MGVAYRVFVFVRGLRMDFWESWAVRRARRPNIVSTVVPERTFKRSIEPPPNDYGVSYLARILRIGFLNQLFYGGTYSAGPGELSIPVSG